MFKILLDIEPFFIENRIYYEVTLSPAVDNPSKFDRITMYTKCELNTNYSIKVSVVKEKVKIFGTFTDIQIIITWENSIRPCEISNFYKIFGEKITFSASYKEYREIMPFLTKMNYDLLDLVDLDEEQYEKIRNYFKNLCKTSYIITLVDKCKYIINNNKMGTNTIRYLLYKCNNAIIKRQWMNKSNERMSNLFLKWGCIPFEEMPFVTSLVKHNPKSYDLFECLDCNNKKDELLARYVQINTQQNGCLYTEISELEYFGDSSIINKNIKCDNISEDEIKKIASDIYSELEIFNENDNYEIVETKRQNIVSGKNINDVWQVSFAKVYNGNYDKTNISTIAFAVVNNDIVIYTITGKNEDKFDNNPIIISKEEAIGIAKNKEKEFSELEISNISAELSIEKMNMFIYCLENNLTNENGELKIEDISRNVWVVNIEHNKDSKPKDAMLETVKNLYNKKYYIDATTGEIIGGEQSEFFN